MTLGVNIMVVMSLGMNLFIALGKKKIIKCELFGCECDQFLLFLCDKVY